MRKNKDTIIAGIILILAILLWFLWGSRSYGKSIGFSKAVFELLRYLRLKIFVEMPILLASLLFAYKGIRCIKNSNSAVMKVTAIFVFIISVVLVTTSLFYLIGFTEIEEIVKSYM